MPPNFGFKAKRIIQKAADRLKTLFQFLFTAIIRCGQATSCTTVLRFSKTKAGIQNEPRDNQFLPLVDACIQLYTSISNAFPWWPDHWKHGDWVKTGCLAPVMLFINSHKSIWMCYWSRGSVLLLHFAVGLPVKNFPQGFVQLLTTNQNVMYFCQIWNPTTITHKQLHNLCRKKGVLLHFSNEFGFHVFLQQMLCIKTPKKYCFQFNWKTNWFLSGKYPKKYVEWSNKISFVLNLRKPIPKFPEFCVSWCPLPIPKYFQNAHLFVMRGGSVAYNFSEIIYIMKDFIQNSRILKYYAVSMLSFKTRRDVFFRFLFFSCFVFLAFPCVFLLILDIFLSFCKIVLWLVAFSSLFFFLFLAVPCFNLLQSLFRTVGVPASACFRVPPPPDNVLLHLLLEKKVLLLLHIRWRAAWKESLLFIVVVDEVDGAGSCGRQRQP